MKKLLYIIIGLMGMMTVQAQNPKERIQVQTDKDFYLAGEKMGLKLYGIDDQGKALEFSRVVYVELLGDKNNVVQLKVEMKQLFLWGYYLSSWRRELLLRSSLLRALFLARKGTL